MDTQVSFGKKALNPFIRIAGGKALVYGLTGIGIATVLSWMTGLHFKGLLHLGGAFNGGFILFLGEHLIVWLIPSLLFYVAGLFLSGSHIRIIDVLGTTAFAQIPLIAIALLAFARPLQALMLSTPEDLTPERFSSPEFINGVLLALVSTIFIVWTLVWMFKALKVSCNLKGMRLGIAYTLTVIGGDILTVYLINLIHKTNI